MTTLADVIREAQETVATWPEWMKLVAPSIRKPVSERAFSTVKQGNGAK